ncbi:efflux transporter outer membrane subunit [Flavobacterium sp. MC2016-06]|jgi:multidrug efflux system outer membrane protein|uniref:efflux transporter outer membrane subunit n=1 Tax=Flavobacterium sp. MC2016-06 TaxID=2676308 RepID=UPI0012BABE45|nr:efflux transporter outer membrane subunit [Flavobacterium sp. MC2016-06]MBU3861493.1 efflux transporter outer membrane subunit [Flavobacterium sp. MC2016-06]
MKNLKSVLVLLIIAVFPYSCMVGPKYAKPEQPKADSFLYGDKTTDTTANVTTIKWSTIFNDPVLIGLIQKGIENNFDLKIAVARLEQVRANLGIAKADLYPAFQYSGQVNTAETILQPSSLVANMSWELDFWGKYRHQTKALQNELLASDEARKVVLSNVVSIIAISYFELRDYDNQLEITQHTLETRQKAYDIINERFKSGYVAELDKVQIEQQVAIAESNIPLIKRQITALENSISVLIGQIPAPIERGKTNSELLVTSTFPTSVPSALLENRPDVKRTELLYRASNERIGVAQAMRYPSFNIAALAGFTSAMVGDLFNDSSYFQNAGASVAGPIFNFGKNKRRVEVNRQIAEENKLTFQKTYLTAISEVENALQNVAMYKEEWTARERQVKAAQKNYDLSNARYYNGYVSYLEVLDAQRSLFEAQLSLSQLTQKQLSSMVLLYKALGGGWN